MFASVVLKAIMDDLQTYLTGFEYPLLLSNYTLNGVTFQRCYYYSQNLSFDSSLLKKIGKSSSEKFLGILFNRSPFEIENNRRFNIRYLSKSTIQTLIASGSLPEDWTGTYKEVSMRVSVRLYSNVLEYITNFEDYYILDLFGLKTIPFNVDLSGNVINLNASCNYELFTNIEKEEGKLFYGEFSIETKFPVIKLIGITKFIQEIENIVYTY